MNITLASLSQTGDRIQFHVFVIAFMLTGAFMVWTASDLGAMAPLVISMGIYAILFGALAEALLGIRLVIARIALYFFIKRVGHQLDAFGGV